MDIARVHLHSLDARRTIFGRALQPGEMFKKGDMYDSMTGGWEPVPGRLLGTPVEQDDKVVFIRPAECTASVPVEHDRISETITDPDSGIDFVRTSCSSCQRWIGDSPLPTT